MSEKRFNNIHDLYVSNVFASPKSNVSQKQVIFTFYEMF